MVKIKILAKESENNTRQFKKSKPEVEVGHMLPFPSSVSDFVS